MVNYGSRPRARLDGSPEFIEFLEEVRRTGGPRVPPPARLEVMLGEVAAVHPDARVVVRLDDSGVSVDARQSAFPDDWAFQVGDVVGVHLVDGEWHTMPHVVRTERSWDRIEFWAENRQARVQRLLAVNTYE